MRLQLLLILLFGVAASAQESTASKQVSTFEIDAPQSNVKKKIWIWLPKEYASGDKKFPVLYMHDAQNVFDKKTSYAGEWEADETLEQMDAQVIVVAIEHGNDKRIDELTPYKHEKYGGGNADAYLEFLVKTLKPEIDKRYRTKPDVKNTAIMGSSLGGLVSFYAMLKHKDVFGKAGVFSPSFWFSKEIFTLADDVDLKDRKLFFLCGTKEDEQMVPDMEKMIEIVKRHHAKTQKKIMAYGKHNEKLWRDHFGEAVKWLFD
ncbi:MAG: alpha/beta hydrolase [Flavobacterium sp.]|uniref:alpha/beta hydrolase n=1 Tax=Flavobacterium sp. TaxID=239 RepID=UPI00121ADC4C|nr:alpha/beta hydrolase-fold protein [Flavobacterium sp.]RZJ67412.1 MAG: alpha/beta hydrolase [Flavobacterium sp.]